MISQIDNLSNINIVKNYNCIEKFKTIEKIIQKNIFLLQTLLNKSIHELKYESNVTKEDHIPNNNLLLLKPKIEHIITLQLYDIIKIYRPKGNFICKWKNKNNIFENHFELNFSPYVVDLKILNDKESDKEYHHSLTSSNVINNILLLTQDISVKNPNQILEILNNNEVLKNLNFDYPKTCKILSDSPIYLELYCSTCVL